MTDSLRTAQTASASPAQRAVERESYDALIASRQSAPANTPAPVSYPRTGGTTSVSFKDGQMVMEDKGNVSINAADLSRGDGSIVSTATSRLGRPLARAEINPESIVRLPGGMTTTAGVAESLGYITRDPHTGIYTDPFEAPAGNDPKPPQESKEGTEDKTDEAVDPNDPARAIGLPDETDEAILGRMVEVTPADEQIAVVKAMMDGEVIPEGVVQRLAERMGVETPEAAAALIHVHQEMEAQAYGVASEYGLDADDFYEWARTHKPDEIKKAVWKHATDRSLVGYVALRNDYLINLDRYDLDYAREGLDEDRIPYRVHEGRIVLQTHGGEMAWSQAVKLGYLKLSKR